MAGRILPDGRVAFKVKISIPGFLPRQQAAEIEKELIADTGSPFTVVPWSNLASFISRNPAIGPILDTNFGKLVKILNLRMTVEVEDHDGGHPETRSCPSLWCHFRPEDAFMGTNGLLGMDQLDSLRADPVKSADGTVARLAKRV
jgi:hypothetical protein